MSGFSGMKAWLIQRFSGIYIGLYAILFTIGFSGLEPLNYRSWAGWMSEPLMQVGTSLFVIALLFHAWIGMRDVILDYIKPIGIKMIVVSGIVIMLLVSGLWVIRALFLVKVI